MTHLLLEQLAAQRQSELTSRNLSPRGSTPTRPAFPRRKAGGRSARQPSSALPKEG